MSQSSGSLFPSRDDDPFLDRSYDPLLDGSSDEGANGWSEDGADTTKADRTHNGQGTDAPRDRNSETSESSEQWELSTYYPNVQSDVLERLARALNHDWSLRTVDLQPVASDEAVGERSIQITFVLERRRVRSLFNVPRASVAS